ncbi:hypothetical protein CDD83_10666 [Cordyceps sp. RAO-2017]|nr:hypothetical protein CDD83_10666 [Cordyceps sp. RAO-2017]
MTRPTIIRADTIDLQDHSAPSAQGPSDSAPGHHLATAFAPHQAETLRDVAHETAEEEARSPRLSRSNDKAAGSGDGLRSHYASNDDFFDSDDGPSDHWAGGGSNNTDMYSHDQQHDALAIAQNGGLSSSDEGELDGDGDGDLDDDMMDKISSSPSIEDEDIDFEFVYALHTFVATVEGQANATKGDTMVLLDDSNSYWWLVRVVKDSSIGYLPAEHIETPTERLARLNKHRNIDLSATMLGDQAQKPKNSFKAIRRRRKTVTFADPTYVDYSDFEYSSEEEEVDDLFSANANQSGEQGQDGSQRASTDDSGTEEDAKVEPLKTRSTKDEVHAEAATEDTADAEDTRGSDELSDNKPDGPSRSRNGTVRNTDSFFKDDSVETKKITLTPNLLRDDNTPRESTESANRDLKSRTSLDKIDKELAPDKEKKKGKDKEKKEKEKKPSAIRSFFSRKDKKKAMTEDDDDSFGKRSMDTISESRDSEDHVDEPSTDKPGSASRGSAKLQKISSTGKAPNPAAQKSVELASYLAEGRNNDVSNVPPASMRIVDPETREAQEVPSNQQQQPTPRDTQRARSFSSAAAPREERSVLSKVIPARSSSAGPDVKPQKTVKAKTRMELDASDGSEADEAEKEKARQTSRGSSPAKGRSGGPDDASRPQVPSELQDAPRAMPAGSREKVSTPQQPQQKVREQGQLLPSQGSPAHVSNPPGLVVDTSSQEGNSPEVSPSPEQARSSVEGQRATGSASRESAWDDAKLRAFFNETDYIRDLLAVVYDKTDVEPAGSDHPVVGGLFREQNAKLAEITTQLDNMLGDWLARKQRLRGTI